MIWAKIGSIQYGSSRLDSGMPSRRFWYVYDSTWNLD